MVVLSTKNLNFAAKAHMNTKHSSMTFPILIPQATIVQRNLLRSQGSMQSKR